MHSYSHFLLLFPVTYSFFPFLVPFLPHLAVLFFCSMLLLAFPSLISIITPLDTPNVLSTFPLTPLYFPHTLLHDRCFPYRCPRSDTAYPAFLCKSFPPIFCHHSAHPYARSPRSYSFPCNMQILLAIVSLDLFLVHAIRRLNQLTKGFKFFNYMTFPFVILPSLSLLILSLSLRHHN